MPATLSTATLRTGLEGKSAAVTATTGPLAAACAATLAQRGAEARLLEDGDPLPDGVQVLVAIFDGADVPVTAGRGSGDEAWEEALAGSGRRLFRLVRDVAAAMHERGGGAVVVIAPEAALVGVKGAAVVAGAAGALFSAARTLAIEYAPTVRINTIAYGCVEGDPFSEWLRRDDPNGTLALEEEALTLLERFARPEEIATTAAFLASDRASFVVGHQLVVDGGYVVR